MSADDSEPKQVNVALSGGYWYGKMGRLYRQLNPLMTLDTPAVVRIDLSGLAGLGPTALAVLTAALMRPLHYDYYLDGSGLFAPRNELVHAYLQRMDLIELFAPGASAEKFKRRKAVGFRPCQVVKSEDQAVKVARDLTDALCEKADLDKIAQMSVMFALSELSDNVVHHAYTPLGGYAVAQHLKRKDVFEIAIADLGVGVRDSLTRNEDYAHITDDVTALVEAVRPQVTSTPERNAGLGLFVTSMLLRMNGGFFDLRSGHGHVTMGNATDARVETTHFPGTIVTLRVRTDRPLNIKQVYREFKDVLTNADD